MQIGKINIDFKIVPVLDPTILMIADNSDWFSAEDKESNIIITPPGSKKEINNIFSKRQLNIFNSSNLGLSCVSECKEQEYLDLSDGIWVICLKSAYQGLEKKRYYLKTDRFLIEWYKEWILSGLDYTDTKNIMYDKLLDVRKHLYSAEGFTLDGDFTKANREFVEAQKKFNTIRKCKDCL
jgi:hypothetical protein